MSVSGVIGIFGCDHSIEQCHVLHARASLSLEIYRIRYKFAESTTTIINWFRTHISIAC